MLRPLCLAAALLAPLLAAAAPPLPAPSSAPSDGEAAFLASRRAVTLQEVLALADQRAPDLAAARAAARQVAAKSRLVFSAALPEISASLAYDYTNARQAFGMDVFKDAFGYSVSAAVGAVGPAYGLTPGPAYQTVVGGAVSTLGSELASAPPTVIVDNHSLYGTLLVQQVLFAPELFLIPAAGEAEQAANLGALEAREQVLAGVAKVYLAAQGLAQVEQAARDAEQVTLRREKEARSLAAVGVSTDIAVLRAQSETAQARSLLASLSGQRVALVAMLEALVGEPVRPLEEAPAQVEVTAGAEADEPWERTFLLRSSTWGLRSQERFNTFDRISWLPKLVAQAKGSYNSNAGFSGKNYSFDAIVAAQWTLYDRGQRYVALHENDAKTAEQRARVDGARAKARATWYGARTNLEAAQVALAESEANAALAARAQQQVESAYRAGFATNLEVTDVDSKRFLAAAGAANARAQLQLRKVELAAAEGRLATVMGLPAPKEE
jgi:outer membrane protein TolC